jgi:hypothetical protein
MSQIEILTIESEDMISYSNDFTQRYNRKMLQKNELTIESEDIISKYVFPKLIRYLQLLKTSITQLAFQVVIVLSLETNDYNVHTLNVTNELTNTTIDDI